MAYLRRVERSPYWVAVFRDRFGKQHFRSTKVPHGGSTPKERADNKKRAEQVAEGYERLVRGETQRESEVKRIALELAAIAGGREIKVQSLREFLTEWKDGVEASNLSRATKAKYKGAADTFIEYMAERADFPVEAVQPVDIQSHVNAMVSGGKASKTVMGHLKPLRNAFSRAFELRALTTNPTAGVKGPQMVSVEREAFSRDEMTRLLANCDVAEHPGEWRTIILLGYLAAMRIGDASRLTWKNVFLDENKLKWTPEKGKAEVEIPIHPFLAKHLLSLPSSDDPRQPLCPNSSKVPQGRRYLLSREFGRIRDKAGIENEMKGKTQRKVSTKTFHSLRHTLASHLAAMNVPPEIRMKLTAHEDERVHAGYTHYEFQQLFESLSKLEGLQ